MEASEDDAALSGTSELPQTEIDSETLADTEIETEAGNQANSETEINTVSGQLGETLTKMANVALPIVGTIAGIKAVSELGGLFGIGCPGSMYNFGGMGMGMGGCGGGCGGGYGGMPMGGMGMGGCCSQTDVDEDNDHEDLDTNELSQLA